MTQEEKAKAYDEIIKKANKMHNENCEACQICIEELISELKESEDERIRKEIISFLENIGVEEIKKIPRDICEWFAWLEKQGESKPAESIKEYNFHGVKFIPKFVKGNIIKNKKSGEITIIKDFSYDTGLYTHTYGQFPITIQDNYEIIEKPTDKVEPKFHEGEQDADKKELKKRQKPTPKHKVGDTIYYNSAWSEEDKNLLNRLIGVLDGTNKEDYHEAWEEKFLPWLKSIKDRVLPQPKQEWSEEDEKMIRGLIAICDMWTTSHSFYTTGNCDMEKLKNWLKSLKDRVLPQPKQEWSEEEIESCAREAEDNNCIILAKHIRQLKSLRPQNHWKPSKEQMIAINTAINVLGKGTLNRKQLIELREQLKKLKG